MATKTGLLIMDAIILIQDQKIKKKYREKAGATLKI
jgi:hypothetical protein